MKEPENYMFWRAINIFLPFLGILISLQLKKGDQEIESHAKQSFLFFLFIIVLIFYPFIIDMLNSFLYLIIRFTLFPLLSYTSFWWVFFIMIGSIIIGIISIFTGRIYLLKWLSESNLFLQVYSIGVLIILSILGILFNLYLIIGVGLGGGELSDLENLIPFIFLAMVSLMSIFALFKNILTRIKLISVIILLAELFFILDRIFYYL